MNVNDNLKLISRQREILVKARTIEEAKIEELSRMLSSVNKEEVFPGIYIPEDISLKAFCPEAYADYPDPDIYTEQYNRMMDIIRPINKRVIEINEEAMHLISEYKNLG